VRFKSLAIRLRGTAAIETTRAIYTITVRFLQDNEIKRVIYAIRVRFLQDTESTLVACTVTVRFLQGIKLHM
jgi:multisubunit Na+/H+ antiporter MnhE subunit